MVAGRRDTLASPSLEHMPGAMHGFQDSRESPSPIGLFLRLVSDTFVLTELLFTSA